MKTDKELVQLVLDHVISWSKTHKHFYMGMCNHAVKLMNDGIITWNEKSRFEYVINSYHPGTINKVNYPYWWPRNEYGVKKRINYLTELIDKL